MSIKDISTAELLGMVSKEGVTISNLMEDNSNVREFLRELEITDGLTLVPTYIIYYRYKKVWRPHGTKLSKIAFFRKINKVFETKRTNSTRYYLLNEGVFDLSKESLDDARKFDKRYRNKIQKKGKPQKQSKAPSITEEIQSENASGLH